MQKSADSNTDKSIGNIIAEANQLTPEQVRQVLEHQRAHGVKFGEAAVELGFAKREDVLWALAQQFHYPYAADGRKNISAELVVATSPFDSTAEFFRDIRSQIITDVFTGKTATGAVALAVCSPDVGDGKSFFAANLAAAFSQLGARTLLVDADMRTPRQHEIFSVPEATSGLSSILAGRSETNVIRPIDALPSLYVLPVGVTPPNPLELVLRPAFDLLLSELIQKFDYIIVDTPAASHGADARVIAAKCGASLALSRKGVSKSASLKALVQHLKKGGNSLFAGTILNDFN